MSNRSLWLFSMGVSWNSKVPTKFCIVAVKVVDSVLKWTLAETCTPTFTLGGLTSFQVWSRRSYSRAISNFFTCNDYFWESSTCKGAQREKTTWTVDPLQCYRFLSLQRISEFCSQDHHLEKIITSSWKRNFTHSSYLDLILQLKIT